jgi:hypothetical protein
LAGPPGPPLENWKGKIVTRQPDSLLSLTDFNGAPLADDLLWKSFRSLMERHGYVFMCNVPDTFDPVAFCKRLGDFVPQYTGVLVGDVTPEPGMEEFYHAGNTKPLYPHSEGYDFEGLPPRYLALWCETPNTGAGGAKPRSPTHAPGPRRSAKRTAPTCASTSSHGRPPTRCAIWAWTCTRNTR